ncbi:hypothetical protein HEP84_12965 [Streptomyces sp. RLB1-33]|nr:hypothetical protein [Streptomyces sp. RLB1-33]QIY69934.1 hypothetical protein HEP84_12965 [Streptomyces sp. RLB1-33]
MEFAPAAFDKPEVLHQQALQALIGHSARANVSAACLLRSEPVMDVAGMAMEKVSVTSSYERLTMAVGNDLHETRRFPAQPDIARATTYCINVQRNV